MDVLYKNLDFPWRLDMSLYCLDKNFVISFNENIAESCSYCIS